MWRVAMLWVLGGCDQLFQIHRVTESESGDGGGVVNPMCPAIGEGPPVFRMGLHEILPRQCFNYTTDETGLSSAMCGAFSLEQGPVGGELAPVTVAVTPSNETIVAAWLAPDGDVLVARQFDTAAPSTHRIATYAKNGAGYTFRNEIFSDSNFATGGVPSAGPARRVFVTQVIDKSFRELEEQGDSWVELRHGPWSDFGVSGTIASSAQLSADGLRLVFTALDLAYYTDRASLDAPFAEPVRIEGIAAAQDAFLTANCERLYFSANGSVFFRELQQ